MNVIDAAYLTAQRYPGGFGAIGERMGMSEAMLRAKLNANNSRNRFAAEEAELMVGLSGDIAIAQAFASAANCVLVPMPVVDEPASVLDLMITRGVREGELARTVQDALADGVITPREWKAIERAGTDAQCVLLRMLAQLCAQVPQKPVAP